MEKLEVLVTQALSAPSMAMPSAKVATPVLNGLPVRAMTPLLTALMVPLELVSQTFPALSIATPVGWLMPPLVLAAQAAPDLPPWLQSLTSLAFESATQMLPRTPISAA